MDPRTNVTDYLSLKAGGKLIKEPEVSDDTGRYSMFNDGGIECEVGEFLYALIRLMKPTYVLETGTHKGVGAAYIGQALKDNGVGARLETYEFITEHWKNAQNLMERLELTKVVDCRLGDVAEVNPKQNYQVMLLDTEPQTRFSELIKFEPFLDEGGFVFIHDLHPHMHQIANEEHGFAWPYGPVPAEMIRLVRTLRLRPFHFRTPRGLTGFYKVAREDYKWRT